MSNTGGVGLTFKYQVLCAAHSRWGLEPQMLMVGEEAVELAHAIFKWRRANKKYLDVTPDASKAEKQEALNKLLDAIAHVKDEAMDALLMIDQLKVMYPDDYDALYDEKLQACAEKLRSRGVQI